MKLNSLLLLLSLLLPGALSISHFWQITDVHVDDDYTPTGDPAVWCRPNTTGAAREEWFGQKSCGLPWRTVQSAVDFMAGTVRSPAAVIWTGDTAPHWPYPDWSHVFPKLRRVSAMLRAAFPDAVIVPSIGNHDAFPSDQFPAGNDTFYSEYLERSGWAELLPEAAQRTFRRGGYYAVDVGDYRVVVLNTALYYSRNLLIQDAGEDPTGQLSWLEEELSNRSRMTVVTAHISPGFPHWSSSDTNLVARYNAKLQALLNRPGTLENRIANIFGHEHIDTFQNVYRTDLPFDKHTYALNTYFMAPALMPGTLTQRINPSVRVYATLPGKLNDYIQFHFDLAAANEAHRQDPSVQPKDFWKVTYRMREAYGLPDVNTRSMHLLFREMKSDDSVFRKYWGFNDGLHGDAPGCDSDCKRQRLCTMSSQLPKQMADCLAGAGQIAASLGLVAFAIISARLVG